MPLSGDPNLRAFLMHLQRSLHLLQKTLNPEAEIVKTVACDTDSTLSMMAAPFLPRQLFFMVSLFSDLCPTSPQQLLQLMVLPP